jgi:acetylornithine deacetylase/succinyl-diaminopimelate desuccinylase-like protein
VTTYEPVLADPASPTFGVEEVARLTSELIRVDTTNHGNGVSAGERVAAELVATWLSEAGIEPVVIESAPGRTNVVARVEGRDGSRPGLLVHGHLDVVPAEASDWRVHPFSGEVADGCVWGRGAVDMKDMDAMTLAVVRDWMRTGRRPERDVVLAFVADEESTGEFGANHLVEHHRDLFDGVTEAVSESGAFSIDLPNGRRGYPIGCAERGTAWMRLTADGTAGHGSKLNPDNAVTKIARAVARLGDHTFPTTLTPQVRSLIEQLCAAYGFVPDLDDLPAVAERLGSNARLFAATTRNTVNPTMLEAGYKVNVIPGTAAAQVDGRILPGTEDDFFATIDELLGPEVRRAFVSLEQAVSAPPHGPTWERMTEAIRAEDPGAVVMPYCLAGGTDAKAFARIGIAGYGFSPLRLPADLDYLGMFHGVDERVSVEALQFGCRVLDRFLTSC